MAEKLSEDKIERIVEMYDSGLTIQYITDELEINRGVVYRYLKEANSMDIPPEVSARSLIRLSEEQKENIVKYYKEGMAVDDILLTVGCSKPTLYEYVSREGLSRKKDPDLVKKVYNLHGTNGVTVADIVRVTGLSTATVYRYVRERKAELEQIEKDRAERMGWDTKEG